MADMFNPYTINTMTLSNRFIRSATYEGLATEEGYVTDTLLSVYGELARGDIGLIIVGYAFVSPNGKGAPRMLGIHSDAYIDGLRTLVQTIHKGGAKVAAQIVHCGRQTLPGLAGGSPVAPSAIEVQRYGVTPRELTVREIGEIVDAFGNAAARAKAAGFDAVQIHSAHGYLLSQFLAANTNRRTDEYGGGIEGRARALFEAYRRIRETVGEDYPVLIKMNCSDFVENGLALEESVWVAARLAELGIDAIEVSGGVADTEADHGKSIQKGVPFRRPEGYFLSYAEEFRKTVDTPIIVVGGIRTLETAQEAVRNGKADLISMCRPFICEPRILKRWRDGDHAPALCISCNRCFARTAFEGLQCFQEEENLRKVWAAR